MAPAGVLLLLWLALAWLLVTPIENPASGPNAQRFNADYYADHCSSG
jgi:hypothetical protein